VVSCLVLAASETTVAAVVVLPVVGLGITVIDGLGRMLLQRSSEPRRLGPLFSLLEMVAALGTVLGSGTAVVLIAVGGARAALVGLAVLLALLLVAAGRAAWRADESADVPVVEMSVLRALPMFAPLPPLPLEALARSARPVQVAAGEEVVAQGEPGEEFYAVVDGELDVVMSGEHIRVATRGDFFGEVALLADVPRTATVTARGPCDLLALDRVSFLVAVTGSDTSREAAWGVVHSLRLDTELPAQG
jgi:MFS family permease